TRALGVGAFCQRGMAQLEPAVLVELGMAQLEPAVLVELLGKQAVAGAAQVEAVAEADFRHRDALVRCVLGMRLVDQQALHLVDAVDYQSLAILGLDAVAGLEGEARQRRVVTRVGALFLGSREKYL